MVGVKWARALAKGQRDITIPFYCSSIIIIIIIMEEYARLLVTKPTRDGEGL